MNELRSRHAPRDESDAPQRPVSGEQLIFEEANSVKRSAGYVRPTASNPNFAME